MVKAVGVVGAVLVVPVDDDDDVVDDLEIDILDIGRGER